MKIDMLDIIRSNDEIHICLENVFDINLLEEFRDIYDEDGHLKFNYEGKVFAIDGSGGEYILLNDGSIGFSGSEGRIGRIAEDVNDLFELVINCPYWEDYLNKEVYQDIEELRDFANNNFKTLLEDMRLDGIDLRNKQDMLAKELNLNLYSDIAQKVLVKLYEVSHRETTFYGEYTEADGEKHRSSGTLFEI